MWKKVSKIFFLERKQIEKRYLIFPVLFLVFLINRPILFWCWLVSLIIFTLALYVIRNFSNKDLVIISYLLKILLGLFLLYLIYKSGQYLRYNSWDGQLWYLKRVLLLKEDFFLDFTASAHPTYLIELILALVWRNVGRNFVYPSFLIVSLVNVILLMILYTKMGFEKNKRNILSLVVVSSPVFIDLAFYQFKVDQFLLMFSLISYIVYLDLKFSGNAFKYLLFGVFSGLAVLTKISVAPFYLALFALHFLTSIKKKQFKNLPQFFMSIFIFSFMIAFWVSRFGLGIPWTTINYYPKEKGPTVVFEKDTDVYRKCTNENKVFDFAYFFDNSGIWDFVLQPVNYLFNINNGLNFLNVSDPGPYLYFSIILFIPLLLKKGLRGCDNLFLATFVYTIYFFISIRTIYWYLFFLFPIYAIPFFDYFFDNEEGKYGRYLVIMFCVSSFLICLFNTPTKNPPKRDLLLNNEYMSKMMNSTEGIILDTSPISQQVFLTFVNDYDKRVVKDSIYFGYSNKSDEEIFAELKEKNIKYIVVMEDNPDDRFEFFGCLERHQERVELFVDKYGELFFADMGEGIWVYELRYLAPY